MSDDVTDNIPETQIVPMQSDPTDNDGLSEDHDEFDSQFDDLNASTHLEDHDQFDSQFDDPNASTGHIDDQVTATDGHAAVLTILPSEDDAFAHDVNLNDSSSLFIPERYSSSHSPAPLPSPPRLSAAPSRPTPPPDRQSATPATRSIFAKVRNMQKLAQERKNALNRHAASSSVDVDLDPEAYLEAVTSGIRPPAGAFPVEVDEDEMAHRQALAEYQKQVRHYESIKEQHNGHLPFRQDVEWMRIRGAEDVRLKMRRYKLAMIHEGDEQDLFPPVMSQADEQDEDYDNEFYDGEQSRKRRRGGQPCKQGKQVSMQDAELRAMRVALEASEDAPKKKQKKGVADENDASESRPSTKSRASKSKAARTSRAKGAGKPTAKAHRKTAKDKRELERATKQATSLFNANVFEQQAGMGAADQPAFSTEKKKDVLKELIASVPIEDKKQARSDMNILLQASRDFDGNGSCKIAPGSNWMVRGMKTSLKGYQVLGSAFMRRRENDTQEPKGGLMADQMGLGKTLMMLGEYTRFCSNLY